MTDCRYCGTAAPNLNFVTKEIKSRFSTNILFKNSYLTVCYVKNYNTLINCLHKESSNWTPTSASSNQNFRSIWWNSTAHYRVNTNPPPVPILCPVNSIHVFPFCFTKFHFNIILTTRPKVSKYYFEFRVLYQILQTHKNYKLQWSTVLGI
jgi:hypothetical protein